MNEESRQKAIEAADETMLEGFRAMKGRRRIAADVVDAILPHLQPDPLTEADYVRIAGDVIEAFAANEDPAQALRAALVGTSLPTRVTEEMVERACQTWNDCYMAGSQGAHWTGLEESERDYWRPVMWAALEAALHPTEPEEKGR